MGQEWKDKIIAFVIGPLDSKCNMWTNHKRLKTQGDNVQTTGLAKAMHLSIKMGYMAMQVNMCVDVSAETAYEKTKVRERRAATESVSHDQKTALWLRKKCLNKLMRHAQILSVEMMDRRDKYKTVRGEFSMQYSSPCCD